MLIFIQVLSILIGLTIGKVISELIRFKWEERGNKKYKETNYEQDLGFIFIEEYEYGGLENE